MDAPAKAHDAPNTPTSYAGAATRASGHTVTADPATAAQSAHAEPQWWKHTELRMATGAQDGADRHTPAQT